MTDNDTDDVSTFSVNAYFHFIGCINDTSGDLEGGLGGSYLRDVGCRSSYGNDDVIPRAYAVPHEC